MSCTRGRAQPSQIWNFVRGAPCIGHLRVYTVNIEYTQYARMRGGWDAGGLAYARRGTPCCADGKGTELVEIIISNASNLPIYEQITGQVKSQIIAGELKAGEQLPSIRALANSLRVSAITTKRAYADLESQGFLETVPGKGCFVAGGSAELLREERLREVEAHLGRAIDAARNLGLTHDELMEMLNTLMESDD